MRRRDVLEGFGGSLLATGRATGHTPPSGTPGSPSLEGTPVPGFEPRGTLEIPGAAEAVVGDDGVTVYVAVHDGVVIVDVTDPTDLRAIASLRDPLADRSNGPLGDIQDVAVDGDRLLVVGPAHRRTGALNAAVLYDVSDPMAPEVIADVETGFPIHNASLNGETAYLTGNDGDANPLVTVDVEAGRERGRWSPLGVDDAWADVPQRLRVIHDVHVAGDRAYCPYWDAGTWILDVRDPADPAALGRVGGRSPEVLAALDGDGIDRAAGGRPGNHHSAGTNRDGTLLAVGKESWAVDGDGGPSGIDLYRMDGGPTLVSTIHPPTAEDPSRAGVWTTVHNFEIADGTLYSAWYQGGVRVHDISDPATPIEIAAWRDTDRTRFWTAQRAGEAVIASSMGVGEDPPGLYTFPLPEGVDGAAGHVTSGDGTGITGPITRGSGAAIAAVIAGFAGAIWLAFRSGDRDGPPG